MIATAVLLVAMTGCSKSYSVVGGTDGPTSIFVAGKVEDKDMIQYKQITMEEAKQIFAVYSSFTLPSR